MGLGLITVGIGCLQFVFDKGQENDWFSSRRITALSVLCLVLLTAFVFHSLRHLNPILDLRMLKQRNFATALVMMFVLGMVSEYRC